MRYNPCAQLVGYCGTGRFRAHHRLHRLFFPGPTLLSLVGLFAIYLILDGILAIVAAVRAARKHERWGFLTFEGIVGIVAGLIAASLPGLTVLVFVGFLAAWDIVSGALELRAAFNLAKAGPFRFFSEYF